MLSKPTPGLVQLFLATLRYRHPEQLGMAAGLLGAALHQVLDMTGIGVGAVDTSGVPANRLEASDGPAAKAQAVTRRSDARHTATLVTVFANPQKITGHLFLRALTTVR